MLGWDGSWQLANGFAPDSLGTHGDTIYYIASDSRAFHSATGIHHHKSRIYTVLADTTLIQLVSANRLDFLGNAVLTGLRSVQK